MIDENGRTFEYIVIVSFIKEQLNLAQQLHINPKMFHSILACVLWQQHHLSFDLLAIRVYQHTVSETTGARRSSGGRRR